MLDQPRNLDPEESFARPDEKEIAAGITITAQVSQNRSIVMQTYLPRDAEVRLYHDTLDKFSRAIGRQEAKESLESELSNLAHEKKTLLQLENDFMQMPARAEMAWKASGKKGEYKPTPNENAQKDQVKTNIEVYRTAIKKREAEISRLRSVIADVD